MRTKIVNATLICILSIISAQAQVSQQFPTLAVPQTLEQEGCDASEVTGNILGVDLSKGTVHVSLTALSSSKFFEIDAGAMGSFVVHSVPPGDYALLVSQRDGIIGLTRVSVAPFTSQMIFQLSNKRTFVAPFPAFQLGGPNCVRSKCYVDLGDGSK